MLRIGLLGQHFIDWAGGLEFLRMLGASLNAVDQPLEVHLLLPVRGPELAARKAVRRLRSMVDGWRGRPTVPSYAPSMRDIREAFAQGDRPVHLHEIGTGTAALERAFGRLRLDVLIPAFHPLATGPAVPWVGYLYDFQHRHLPHLFSEQERVVRDRQFSAVLDSASVVIVNARAVERDALEFRPQMRARIVPMPINASPPREWFASDAAATRSRYGLDQPYLIICNQFWIHKDHRTAFDAFARIAGEFPELQLVCTGATSDYRDPGHFEGLLEFARTRGIRERLHILGLVPKQDQIDLVRGARAVVQPTLSEGGPGGGAAYDAIALGVPALVSDIPVNLEIEEPNVTFFRAGDPQALADAVRTLLSVPAPPAAEPDQLIRAGNERRRRCGLALLRAIDMARTR
jgi:glycosyltransferase involved in cell wall biosynthesis